MDKPCDGVQKFGDDRARLRWKGREAEVRGLLPVWLLCCAWEKRGKLITWSVLLEAKYKWEGRLESVREAVKGRAVDGSTTDAAQGAHVIGADNSSLKRICRV